ncbi:hypothetical protein OG613_44900 (plasmid) [Streptomyces sp. NBC_00015]
MFVAEGDLAGEGFVEVAAGEIATPAENLSVDALNPKPSVPKRF